MYIPASTYRVQLHKDFTLRDLDGIIDYLETLGITTIYAAPIVKATPASMHGYDVTDPHMLNPEIGTLDEFKALVLRLKEKNITWLQDIVPNHMAYHVMNHRLMDVLERGDSSPYYNYFDINWRHHKAHLKGKLQVPFLGSELEQCVNNKEIKISFSDQGFTVDYFQTSYPLSLPAYATLLQPAIASELKDFVREGESISDYKKWKGFKKDFISRLVANEQKHFRILELLEVINNDKNKLLQVLDNQHYVLQYWKHTEKEISYRRFFTVNELICLRMEDKNVFDEYHTFLHSLYKDQLIQGVRIDHIDGLQDPARYTRELRQLFGEDCYIIAEKILEAKEDMPEHWPLQGTSGYEFLSFVSQLITNRKGAKELLSFYKSIMPQLPPYKELVLANKKLILDRYMAGEWDNLVHYFATLGLAANYRDDRIKEAIGSVMTSLPVYRIYPDRLPLKGGELLLMNEAFEKALLNNNIYKPEIEYLKSLFTQPQDNEMHDRVLSFLKRLMQFTGPLTAKGVEDTTFYVYNALISHDEVGDAPSTLGISISNFHNKMTERQKRNSLSLSATATHDTKRGEDARLRLNVLCEYPEQWKTLVSKWFDVNRKFHQRTSKGKLAPETNDEYYIYQAIVGGFPDDFIVTEQWIQRLQAYYTKVVREAKLNSDWGDPDKEYEDACHSFIRNILSPDSDFLTSFLPFIRKVTDLANRYALGQVLIKITAPGIPDTYQGCELWDLSFVDPDNRRPVDYESRRNFLNHLIQKEAEGPHVLFPYLEDNRNSGVEKLFVTWKSLNFRKKHPNLFTEGHYTSLQLTGKEIITVAYARHLKNRWAIIVVPLRVTERKNDQTDLYSNDEVILPESAPQLWQNVFTGEMIQTQGRLSLSSCFTRFPVALFTNY